jgi:phosphomannomutase
MNTLRTLKAGAKFYDGQIIDHTHDLLSENYKGFAHTNILIFKLQNGTRVIARPSGTEPKIKFYAEQTAQIRSAEELDIERARLDDELDAIKKKVSAAFARPH